MRFSTYLSFPPLYSVFIEASTNTNCIHLRHTTYILIYVCIAGLARWYSDKESTCQNRRFSFYPWRRKWQPTPVFLPGKSLGQRSLADYTVYRVAKSQTWLSTHGIHSFAKWPPRSIKLTYPWPRIVTIFFLSSFF